MTVVNIIQSQPSMIKWVPQVEYSYLSTHVDVGSPKG